MNDIGDRLTIYFAAFITFATFQSPQPLYNTLQAQFGVSPSSLSLLVTVIFMPLAVAPLGYGFLLESLPPKRILSYSFFFLALSQLPIVFAPSFGVILGFRVLQGLLIPAILTSLMTFIGTSSSSAEVQSSMAMYIGSTILGGFLGRLLSGLFSSLLGWRYALFFYFLGLAVAFVLCLRLSRTSTACFKRPQLSKVPAILKKPGFLRMYCIVFCAFFVFASLLNFLPFRLAQIGLGSSGLGDLGIGVMYTGFVIGILVSLTVNRFIALFGSEIRAVLFGAALYLASLLVFLVGDVYVIFLVMFTFCGGMFLVHTILPGYLNKLSGTDLSLVNGLYLCFYYTGGAVGSFFPGIIFRHYGWNWYVLSLALVLAACLLLALSLTFPKSRTA